MKWKYMRARILMLFFLSLLFRCTPHEADNSITNEPFSSVNDTTNIDTGNVKFTDQPCKCDWVVKNLPYNTDLTFSNNGKPFNPDSLSKWKNNPRRLQIKSLELIDFDSVPDEMAIFENVESVSLQAMLKNTRGLEKFPKLKILRAEEGQFVIDESTKWLNKLEVIHVNKTEFTGLKSFTQLPNLKEAKFSFSGFDIFPNDFESMKCLSFCQLGAYTFGEMDLNKLDLKDMGCLKYIEFHTWRNNIKGIPKGFEHIGTVKVSHPNLTKKEKVRLLKAKS